MKSIHLLGSRKQNEDFEIKSIQVSGKDEIAGLTGNFNALAKQQRYSGKRRR
jgi:hypothetical protein